MTEARPPAAERGLKLVSQRSAPYVFIAPFFVLFVTFVAFPLVYSIWLSLHDTVGLNSRVFVGFENFGKVLHDPQFGTSLRNTMYFLLGSLFIQLPLAFGLALILNAKVLRAKSLFRFAFFSPVLIAGVFIAIVFQLVFDHEYGMLNYFLRAIRLDDFLAWLGTHFADAWEGVPLLGSAIDFHVFGDMADLNWLHNDKLVMPAIIMAGVWRWTGFNMIYFLAGLQGIREELYEAASIDGAGPWARLTNVTLPGLKPVLIFVVVMSTIGSIQLFDIPYILLGGSGPNDSGLTVVMYLYRTGFQYTRLGYAATIGWAIFLIIFIVSVLQMRFLARDEER